MLVVVCVCEASMNEDAQIWEKACWFSSRLKTVLPTSADNRSGEFGSEQAISVIQMGFPERMHDDQQSPIVLDHTLIKRTHASVYIYNEIIVIITACVKLLSWHGEICFHLLRELLYCMLLAYKVLYLDTWHTKNCPIHDNIQHAETS